MLIWSSVYPYSSLSAASGYAEEIGLPYEMGLVKNQYVARTFIQPTQELREQGVRVKLSAVKDIVDGKNIILVDDSIVRGTTIRRIVKMLKDSGASACAYSITGIYGVSKFMMMFQLRQN